MSKQESFNPQHINFVGEQDGVPERKLKTELTNALKGGNVRRAYLARVNYGEVEEFNVALCLQLDGDASDIQQHVNQVFSTMFRTDEHLDVIVLNDEEEQRVTLSCNPFFISSEHDRV